MWKRLISSFISPITNKVVTMGDSLSSIEPYYPFLTWSCEVTWQIKNVVSPFQQNV